MSEPRSTDIERSIAQCRVMLSVAAFVTVYIDPTRPTLMRLAGGPFTLDPWALAVMLSHLAYSLSIFLRVGRVGSPKRLAMVSKSRIKPATSSRLRTLGAPARAERSPAANRRVAARRRTTGMVSNHANK